MSSLLIIEDEEPIRRVLKKILLEEDAISHIEEAADGKEGLEKIKNNEFDLVICDIKMPKMDGIEVLEEIRKLNFLCPFIVLTGHSDMETAVSAMKMGAFDFISKPPDLNRLLISVRNAIANNNLSQENKILKKKVSKRYEIIGESKEIKEVFSIIDKVAGTNARVLITGENGTGKELVAHQIHQKSERRRKAMVEVNCAAIPSELIESELFGHKKGSFTSAIKDRMGKFEAANQSTLFLDEIGDLSLNAQAKLLRVLQEGVVQQVGSEKAIKVDVRVIAATNKDLKLEIKEGRFREDLYHRLVVIEIKLPRLRDRKSDISLLCTHFVKMLGNQEGLIKKEFTKGALDFLQKRQWKGNVRELKNAVERLLILGENPITEKDVEQFTTN